MPHKGILATQTARRGLLVLACLLAAQISEAQTPQSLPPSAVDFERHVAPLLGRHGCNTAACHGAFGGRGGLQLSLFGHSPALDFENLSPYIDGEVPYRSLMLLKPAGQEDHGGGLRFEADSPSYRSILRWIEQGAAWRSGSARVTRLSVQPPRMLFAGPTDQLSGPSRPLTVIAEFSDGSREDVTHLSQFRSRDEGIATVSPTGEIASGRCGDTSIVVLYGNALATTSVLVAYPSVPDTNFEAVADNPIDAQINEKLRLLNIQPSPPCGDAEFLRRVTLDTIGTIPAPGEVTRFCASTDPHKREKLVDQLLSHPMHAALWATRMCDITKCDLNSMGDDKVAGRRAQMWHDWFRTRFARNEPYDRLVRAVITATSREGRDVQDWMQREEKLIRQMRAAQPTAYAQRATLDLYWRRNSADGRYPLKEMAELTAVAFTGVRLNCAQCHKHPFDRWTQDDYAAFVNVFSHVVLGSSTELNVAIFRELEARREARKRGDDVTQLPRLREVFVSRELGRGIAGTRKGAPVPPRPLDSEPFDPQLDLRRQFFDWLLRDENPYFAPSFVNRVWAVYFGIGIVDPVDDFSAANPPSHPQLLQELADTFRNSRFDIRALEKRIMLSDAYQRSAAPNESNWGDRRNFARQQVRPLLAEVALDVINKALGVSEDFGSDALAGTLAIEIGSNQLSGDAGRVLDVLGRGERESICDCDRRSEVDLRQFILLIGDETISEKISAGSVRKLLELDNATLLEQLYLRFLGRQPGDHEAAIGLRHFASAQEREAAFDDLVWGLVNTREFITNH